MLRSWIRIIILVIGLAGALAAGYFATASIGVRALRAETEKQLEKLLLGEVEIEKIRIVIRGGLFLEAQNVRVYPRDDVPGHFALFGEHVAAELDVFAMLTGRFKLSSLTGEGVVFEIDRFTEEDWAPAPFQILQDRQPERLEDDLEQKLVLFRTFESAARFLLRKPMIARRMELERSRLVFRDWVPRAGRPNPLTLDVKAVEGRLIHHWLSGDADLDISGVLIEGVPSAVPIHVTGHKRRNGELHLSANAEDVPMRLLEFYVVNEDSPVNAGGTLSGELTLDTEVRDHGTMSLRGIVADFSAEIPLEEGPLEIRQPELAVEAVMEIHPGRLRLLESSVDADGVVTRLSGTMARPLRMGAVARLETAVEGLELEEVRAIAESLPGQDPETLSFLLETVASGQVDSIGGMGRTTMSGWQRLLRRDVEALPDDFTLTSEVSGISVKAGANGLLTEVGARVELAGDHLQLRRTTALWNGDPLPAFDLSIDGISDLFKAPRHRRVLAAEASMLPGLKPLWEIISGGPDEWDPALVGGAGSRAPIMVAAEDDASRATPMKIKLRLDQLDHPALRWPIRNASLVIRPENEGSQIEILEGQWAGARIDGTATWTSRPEQALSVSLAARPAEPSEEEDERARLEAENQEVTSSIPGARGDRWAAGRFEINVVEGALLPLHRLSARFTIDGQTVQISQVRADVEPTGKLVARTTLNLADPEKVAMDANFSLIAADIPSVGAAFGMSPGFAEGDVHFSGALDGYLHPDRPLIADLRGEINMDARNGQVFRRLPLVAAIAKASEGFNRYSARDAIPYEVVSADWHLDRGQITTENFHLEGPLRIFGWANFEDVHTPNPQLTGIIGVFLFRRAGNLMETVPLVKAILPGSEKGLVGAYYRLGGELADPQVVTMTERSITEDLPDVLSTPLKILRSIVGEGQRSPGSNRPTPKGWRRLSGTRSASEPDPAETEQAPDPPLTDAAPAEPAAIPEAGATAREPDDSGPPEAVSTAEAPSDAITEARP